MTARKKYTQIPSSFGSELDGFWPSHTPFDQILDYSADHIVVGDAPHFVRDHVAELSELLGYDTAPAFWFDKAAKEGIKARKILYQLADNVQKSNDVDAARTLYAIATYASFEVMLLYLRRPELFNFIAARCTILPCLASIHPNTSKVMAAMRRDAPLGKLTPESHVIGSRAWFTSSKPANVYARAIVTAISLNQGLEPIAQQKKTWAHFDKVNHCKTRLLPFPAYIEGIDRLPRKSSPDCVLQYWRKGKEMILEEMPNFHLRPEWRAYAERRYQNGAKTGAIQHAIFKDILTALRLMAGSRRPR
jgi:hypothetical protein